MELLAATRATAAVGNRSKQFIAHPFFKKLLYFSVDVLTLRVAHATVSMLVLTRFHDPSSSTELFANGYAFVPFFILTLYLFGCYGDPDLRRPDRELELLSKSVTVAFLGLLATAVLARSTGSAAYYIGAWYVATLISVVFCRFSVRGLYGYLWKNGLGRTRVLLMGPSGRLLPRQNMLELQRHRGYDVVGIVSPDGRCDVSWASVDIPILGDLERWEDALRALDVQLVLLSLQADPACDPSRVIRQCTDLGIRVMFFDAVFNTEEFDYAIDSLTGTIHLYFKSRLSCVLHSVCKRVLDLTSGLIGSLCLVAITPILAALINLEDGGPVFYRSAYLGQDGKDHYYFKFRTMCMDADQVLTRDARLRKEFEDKFKLETDPRVTRIGRVLRKYSLDEFPQFLSVLLGRLSLVGPRTIRREEAARYADLLPKLLSVRPGLTGFWQVMGRQTTSYDERVQMDMFYIDHWSIWLDLVIVAKTFWTVLSARGAY